MNLSKNTLITDFDNTLYDWFHMWHQSFSVMLREISRISGINEEYLIPEIRQIHQRFRTSEYAFLIEDMPTFKKKYPGENLTIVFDEAIHAYRSARKENLRLYDGVPETLMTLKQAGVTIAV